MPKMTDELFSQLKRELNLLLWTDDPPKDKDVEWVGIANVREYGAVNMHCASHAFVTAALLFGGPPLRLLKGRAFIADGPNEHLHEIGRHYWILLNEGFIDLSLYFETAAPAVIGQRCLPSEWQVELAQSPDELNQILKRRERSCIYTVDSQDEVTRTQIISWMNQPFDGAIQKGIRLPLGSFFAHCNRLLKGEAKTLTNMAQIDAWRALSQVV